MIDQFDHLMQTEEDCSKLYKHLIHLDQVDSTNKFALNLSEKEHGVCIYSKNQFYFFGLYMMAKTSITKPIKIKIGASVILWKLNISGLKLVSSPVSPPDINIKPEIINAKPTNIIW